MVKKGEQCPTCEQYYDRHIVVDGLVIKDKSILLIKRGIEPNKGMYALPGGYLDWDETTEDAVLREVWEETHVKARVERMLGGYSHPQRDTTGRQNVAITYVLSVLDDSTMKPQEGEVLSVEWYQLTALPENIAFDHKKIIADFVSHTQM